MGAYDDLLPKGPTSAYADLAGQPSQDDQQWQDLESQAAGAAGTVTQAAAMKQAPVLARGIVQGATSPVTMPADVGIWATNKVRKHLDPNATTLDTDASDLVNAGLDRLGMTAPTDTGGQLAQFAGNMIGGFGGGALTAPASSGLSASQAAASRLANWSKAANADMGVNQLIYNNAWGKAIGAPAGTTKLTGSVIQAADERLGKIFDMVRNPDRIIQFDSSNVAPTISAINDELTPANKAILESNVVQRTLSTLQRGHANGQELGDLSSALGKSAKAAMEKDPEFGSGLFKVKDLVDGYVEQTLDPAQKQIYAAAKSQYKALWSDLAPQRSGNLNMSTGDADPFAIGRHLQRTNTMGLAGANTSDAYEATRLAGLQAGKQSLMGANAEAVMGRPILMTLARLGPSAVQWAQRVGLPTAMRMLTSNPQGMAALAQTLKSTPSPAEDH